MRQVQEALKNIGIPVIAGIWRATSPNQNPPVQYVVYSSTTTETAFQNADPDVQYFDDQEGDVLYPDPELSFKTKLADLPLIIP